jgi:hypothetical protein
MYVVFFLFGFWVVVDKGCFFYVEYCSDFGTKAAPAGENRYTFVFLECLTPLDWVCRVCWIHVCLLVLLLFSISKTVY